MKALVIAEHADAARELCAGARSLAEEVLCVSLGEGVPGAADRSFVLRVPEARVADDAYASIAPLMEAESPEMVLAEPTRHVRSVVGRLASACGEAVITDVISFEDGSARSLYFGGVAERVRKSAGSRSFFTVSAGAFGDGATSSGSDSVEELEWVEPVRTVELVSSTPVQKSGVDLSKAEVVVAAGRGFAEEADLDLARDLCAKLDAGLACSRPLTEGVNWLPSELYVGVSGLMLSPKVYIAAGISGQMQHMVGCNRSGVLIAINKDANAPIFKQCDFGLIGDVKTVLPALVEAL